MPRLSNLLRRPEVTSVETVAPTDLASGRRALEVHVDGLACDSLCVRRTEGALRSIPGVVEVRFTSGPDRFRVESSGAPPDRAAIDRAVAAVVVAPWARRLLAALAERLGISPRRR
jgi:hypothetical protein